MLTVHLALQAKDAAHAAANSAHRSAKATWSALERMTQAYTNSRQYYMLDDLVEATSAAKKVPAPLYLPCSLDGPLRLGADISVSVWLQTAWAPAGEWRAGKPL